MKRLFWMLLAVLLVFTLQACGDDEDPQAGTDGREIVLRVEGGFIQWQYAGETTWTNLLATTALVGLAGEQGPAGEAGADGEDGEDGREIEFRLIQEVGMEWRYVGADHWVPLYCFACDVAEAYDLVHGHYVGYAKVWLLPDGTIFNVFLDEYYLPYSWAKLGSGEGHELAGEADTVVRHWARGATQYHDVYAKYIKVGGWNFEARVTGEPGAHKIEYRMEGSENPANEIEVMIAEAANFDAAYVAALYAGDFTITNATYAPHPTYVTVASDASSQGINKWATPYWRFGTLGWIGNVEATIAAVIGMDLSAGAEAFTLVKDDDSKLWSIDDEVSGATWSDFADYFELIVKAYNKVPS